MKEINNNNLNIEMNNNIKKYINSKFKDKDENEEIEMVFYLDGKKQGKDKMLNVSYKLLSDVEKYSDRIFELKGYFEKLNSIFRLFISELADFNNTLKIQKIVGDKNELVTANRHFLNLISNGKLLVDFSENQIKRIFGAKSEEAINIHLITSNIYDQSKIYRLFYNLRNFSQHHGFPITLIKKIMINDDKYKILYFIDINYLIDSKFDFQRIFISDLKEYRTLGENLNLEELIMPYFELITKLFGKYNEFFLNLYKDELIEIKENLVQQGLCEGKYYTAKFTKKEINSSMKNLTLNEVYGKSDIDGIFTELSKLGLVNLKRD